MAEMLLQEPAQRWTGPALTKDLAAFLRESHWITVTEMYLPGWDARVDVMAIKPHAFATQDLRIYEVKVSRQDYHADERANKWRKYLDVAHRVFFACPAGLLRKDEIPKEAGLIVRGPKGWSVLKAPKGHQPPGLTVDVVMAMLFKVHNTDVEIREIKKRIVTKENVNLADAARNIDHRIRERLRDGLGWKTQRRVDAAEMFFDWCGKTLGLNPDTHTHEIECILKAGQSLTKLGDTYGQIHDAIRQLSRAYLEDSAKATDELQAIVAKAREGQKNG